MKRVKMAFFLLLSLGIILLGCNNRPDNGDDIDIIVPSITTENGSYTLKIGDEITIKPIITNGDSDLEIICTTADANIAIVDENGKVTAISHGETTITFTLEKFPTIYVNVLIVVEPSEQDIANEILLWAKDYVGDVFGEYLINFPKTHPEYDDVEIIWISSNDDLICENGFIYQKEFDQDLELTVTVNYKNATLSDTYKVTVLGYAAEIVANDFFNQFNYNIVRDYSNIQTTNNKYPNVIIAWISSDLDVFTNQGQYLKPINDKKFIIYVTVTFPDDGLIRTFEKEFLAKGTMLHETMKIIENDVLKDLNINKLVVSDLELPTYHEGTNAILTWSSNKPNIVSSTGAINWPNLNQMIILRCEVNLGSEISTFRIEFEVASRDYDEVWEAVDSLLEYIFLDEIKTQRMHVYGVYFDYIFFNYGYIPFYFHAPSIIIQDFMPRERNSRPETRYIVIHDTANTSETANAEMHARWAKTEPGVSWHFSVDDKLIYQHLPLDRIGAHAGTTEGNRYGVGIEKCINVGIDYNDAFRKTAKLTSELLKIYDLTLYDVRQHFHFSGKDCPRTMRAANRWDEFLNIVAMEFLALNYLQNVQFEWQSLTPQYLDDFGRIRNHPGHEVSVSYKAIVTYNGETKEFTHTARLLPPSWL